MDQAAQQASQEEASKKVVEEAAKQAEQAQEEVIQTAGSGTPRVDTEQIMSLLQANGIYIAAVVGVMLLLIICKCVCCRGKGAAKKKRD